MMGSMNLFDLSAAGRYKSRRESSYDREGGNVDWVPVPAGGRQVLLDADGPGIVTHLWFALGSVDNNYLRYVSIKAWWDGNPEPSIDCPFGDFFGVGHAAAFKYDSLVMNMVRGTGQRGEATGMNCHLAMPFARHARIEVVNDSPAAFLVCYYQVDWLQTDQAAVATAGRLHASWRRENPTARTEVTEENAWAWGRFGRNRDGKDNFLVADIRGKGRFIGMNLSIDNIDSKVLGATQGFGEGDEMIFIDDDTWPPALHGTGTEDYFCEAWGMCGKSGLYSGTSLPDRWIGGTGTRGTCYRFHLSDPVYFQKKLRFTFEHGSNNCKANDLSATAYWYQDEPVGVPALPPIGLRRPNRAENEPAHADEDKVVQLLAGVVTGYYDLFLKGNRAQVAAIGQEPASLALPTVGRVQAQFMAGAITVDDVAAQLQPCSDALKSARELN